MPHDAADLLVALSDLARRYPEHGAYLRAARYAILGLWSKDGAAQLIVAHLGDGCCTYQDLRQETGLAVSSIQRALSQLIAEGVVVVRCEPREEPGRPKRLFFLKE